MKICRNRSVLFYSSAIIFFFFKQKTAYEMRISDWSSDVCSSDLLPLIEHTVAAICGVFPIFTRMRMLRKWGGVVDVTPDRSPILGKTPVPGLYVNCGWGTGGFKATPGSAHVFAHTIARDEPHPINAPYTLERFTTGDRKSTRLNSSNYCASRMP